MTDPISQIFNHKINNHTTVTEKNRPVLFLNLYDELGIVDVESKH